MLVAATSYGSIIRPLQFLIFVIVALFFAIVLRVVIQEIRSPDEVASSSRRRRFSVSLTFVEPEERAREKIEVGESLVVGRSAECDLALDDTYLSSRHARFTTDNGDLIVEDLGSTNGTYVNQELVKERTIVSRGDIIQIGGVIFEVSR